MKEEEAVRWAAKRICGCSEAEYRQLYRWVMNAPDFLGASVLEIGAGEGGSTTMLAAACQERGFHLFCLDPFHLGCTELQEKRRIGWGGSHYQVFMSNCHRLIESGLRPWVTYLNGDSHIIGARMRFKNNLNFIWIDGEHAYPFALNEFRFFSPDVVVGGIVAFHDAHEQGRAGRCIAELEESGELDNWKTVDCPPLGTDVRDQCNIVPHKGPWQTVAKVRVK
jgi:hypothetical protein